MDTSLQGSVVLVTGAARNIGAQIARACAVAGAAVAVNARSSATAANALVAEIEGKGGRAAAILGDIAEPRDVARVMDETIARFGRLDVLVNNAAPPRDEGTFEELTLARWHAVMRVVLDGAFLCSQAALPHLRASGRGAIVNFSGLTAHTGAANRAHVVTAKAGIAGLTRALALDLAADGITVNCIAPGLIDTVRQNVGAEPSHRAQRVVPLGRKGVPADVAAAVCWLAGPGARFVTGQTLHVNGGLFLT